MIQVRRTQHAVGQGGFHSAEVLFEGATFRYVYDVGTASPRSALRRELRSLSHEIGLGEQLELLVLSHLDEDHVNGVDELMSMHDVDTVLLPYLSPWERVALVVEACERRELTPSRLELIYFPERWFRDRGARTVAFVLPSAGPQLDAGGAAPPPPPANSGERILEPTDRDGPGPKKAPTAAEQSTPGGRSIDLEGPIPLENSHAEQYPGLPKPNRHVEVLPPRSRLYLRSGSSRLWQLVPFVHPEPERLVRFIEAVRALLRTPRTSATDPHGLKLLNRVKEVVADKRKRVQLAGLYGLIRAERNLSSMSLYSGPDSSPSKGAIRTARLKRSPWSVGAQQTEVQLAWMATGDSVLKRENRAAAFAEFYRGLLSQVGVFALPHHGSKHNFTSGSFARPLSNVDWVAAHGARLRYGHPDALLVRGLARRGKVFHVTDSPETRYEDVVVLP